MTRTVAGLLAIGVLVLAALARPQAPTGEALDPQVRAELHRRLDTAVSGYPGPAPLRSPAEPAARSPHETAPPNRR